MKQVLQYVRSRRLEVVDVPAPAGRAGGVLVRNAASLISAGTEKMIIDFAGKSLLGKARERPDLVRQVIDKVRKDGLVPTAQAVLGRLDQPIALGYSCAGIVEESGKGAEEFSAGDRVACAGMGYASHADIIYVPRNLAVRIPDGVSFEDASYVTLGAIALHGVRVADVRLGECVAVIGLGLLGQLSVQMLKASGCRVVGIDLDPAKVELARRLGADAAFVRDEATVAAVAAATDGVGADAVLIAAATGSNDPTELAGEIARDRGRVVVVGAVRMDVPRKVFYDKELDLRLSRSYGPGRYDAEYEERGLDYPLPYVRWTERRNMAEFLRLVALGQVRPAELTTHRFAIADAERAYELIGGGTGEAFSGVVLTYPERDRAGDTRVLRLRARGAGERPGIGFIGAGNFARAVLLPQFAKASGTRLVGIATATGVSGRAAAERHGFEYCTTEIERLLDDRDIAAVVIATRHGSHARLAARALRAGKGVFLEKPLAIDEEGLADVLAAQRESGQLLTVGFNRRFSPVAAGAREPFRDAGPLAIAYRVNAGAIPSSHWVHDAGEGGGRIIGEGCHFIDLVQFLADSEITEVFAHAAGGPQATEQDTVTISLRLRNGTVATIGYYAIGDRGFSKERFEIFGGGAVAVAEDFRELVVTRGGRSKRQRFVQDKGFATEIAAFLRAVREGGEPPIPLRSLELTTRASFAAVESLRTGLPVAVAAG